MKTLINHLKHLNKEERIDFVKSLNVSTRRKLREYVELYYKNMPTRRLGKTNMDVSLFSLGGIATLSDGRKENLALEIINKSIDSGVNLIDTAAAYGNGTSEFVLGKVLKDRRKEVYITTKTEQREQEDLIEKQFNKSIERLQTDFVDIYFLHGISTKKDLSKVLDPVNGAIVAFEKLRESGKIGNIGISGHNCEVLMDAMRRYDFHCVFVTINPINHSMDDPKNLKEMLAMAEDKDVGVMSMKIMGQGDVLEKGHTVQDAFKYALDMPPVATANVGISDIKQLEENIQVVKSLY